MPEPVVTPAPAAGTPPAPPAPAAGAPPVPAPAAPAAGEAPSILTAGAPSPDAGPPDGAPAASGDIELKLPEGVTPDDALITKFKPLAKELGLDSAKAQKLVELYAGSMQASVEKTNAAWSEQQTKWATEVKSDKELGGAQFEATKTEVRKFFNAFDKDGSIRKEIAALGIGNHPALVRLAARAAKSIGEDSVAGRSASGTGEQSGQELLRHRYPTMFPQS